MGDKTKRVQMIESDDIRVAVIIQCLREIII